MTIRKLTAEGRFECGLDAVVAGKAWAFVAVPGENARARLGIAIANEAGYNPIPETWCHGDNLDEMHRHADELNETEGLNSDVAGRIVMSTLAAQNNRT